MFKPRLRLPSPALVISMVALSLVLGGTAVAAGTATHKDKKADAKLIKKMAPSLSVKHAKTADSATTAASATHATSADTATNATNATTAANSTQLGGSPASAYERTSSIMWATVTNNGTTVTVARSTPGVTAAKAAPGNVNVTFPRDVSSCGWIATQGNPGNNFVPADFATVRGDGTNTDVEVITWNTGGNQVDVNFHLVVIC
jgi:hypothetical protein